MENVFFIYNYKKDISCFKIESYTSFKGEMVTMPFSGLSRPLYIPVVVGTNG